MYKVFITDDEPYVIEGLKIMIDWEKLGMEICGESDNGLDGIEKIIELCPDIIITDIRMPDMDGLEMIERLREESCDAEIIILSGYGQFDYARRALKSYVKYFILKPLDKDELTEALEEIKAELDRKVGMHNNSLYLYNNDISYSNGDITKEEYINLLPIDLRKKLVDAIELMNVDEMEKYLKEIFDYMIDNKAPLASVHIVFMGILHELFQILMDRGINVSDFTKNQYFTKNYFNNTEGKLVMSDFQLIVKEITERLLIERKKESIRHLWEIKEYLDNNYETDITINYIAEKFFFDPVYIGNAFTKEFGKSIITYVHDLRIDKACAMIKSGDMTFSRISKKVGYNNYNNFLYHFQKRTGATPAEYEKKS